LWKVWRERGVGREVKRFELGALWRKSGDVGGEKNRRDRRGK